MNNTTLPDYVILSKNVDDNCAQAENALTYANVNLKKLKAEGIPTELATLKAIIQTDEAFKEWLNEAEKSYIGKLGFVPIEEKIRIHKTFVDLQQRVDSPICSLRGFLFSNLCYKISQDKDGSLVLDMEELKERLEAKHRKSFTELDKKYYALIYNANLAFKAVQDFEQKEKYIPFSISQTFWDYIKTGVTPQVFANSYEWGKMSKAYLKFIKEDEE